jgi:hypothetical protein
MPKKKKACSRAKSKRPDDAEVPHATNYNTERIYHRATDPRLTAKGKTNQLKFGIVADSLGKSTSCRPMVNYSSLVYWCAIR